MASGYCFNGRSQTIQGRSALLFGVDAMSALGQKDLIPVMHHELFHRYHRQFFDFEASGGYPLWTALWAEGLATYVAEELNPSASEIDLAMVPLGMVQQVDDRRAELAADFLRRFESTAEKDATVYFNDINSKDAVVPARAGYRIGRAGGARAVEAVFASDHGALVAGRGETEDSCSSRADQRQALALRLDLYGRPVAQHFRQTRHQLGRVVAHRNDRVCAELAGVLAHQAIRLLASLLAQLRVDRDVAAEQRLDAAEEIAHDGA